MINTLKKIIEECDSFDIAEILLDNEEARESEECREVLGKRLAEAKEGMKELTKLTSTKEVEDVQEFTAKDNSIKTPEFYKKFYEDNAAAIR